MVSDCKFGSHWTTAIAFGIALVALVAMVSAWHLLEAGQPEFARDPQEQHIDPDYCPGGRECQPSIVNRLPWGERFDRTVACRESAEQHRLQANDLIQQRRAANAAATAVYFAQYQTILGIFGAGFGFLTLCAAIAAAHYAKRAADAAKDAVRAADDTVATTRGIGQAQVRAHLTVVPGLPFDVKIDRFPSARVVGENVGQSPAHQVSCRCGIVARNWGFDGREDFLIPSSFDKASFQKAEILGTVGANGEASISAQSAILLDRNLYQRCFDRGDDAMFLAVSGALED